MVTTSFVKTTLTIALLSLSLSIRAEAFDVSVLGLPAKPFKELCDLVNLKYDGSLKDLVNETQSQWLRKPGTERWHIEEKLTHIKQEALSVLTDLGMRNDLVPVHKEYKYAVIFGSLLGSVKNKIDYLIKMYESGLCCQSLVFLSGYRELQPSELKILKEEYNREDITTEPEMMRFLYTTITDEKLKKCPFIFVEAPARTLKDGEIARATTACTVKSWMDLKPKAGTCLLFSSQPHCVYQNIVAQTLLPKSFIIETVGKATQDTRIEVYLDALARAFYQYQKSLKS